MPNQTGNRIGWIIGGAGGALVLAVVTYFAFPRLNSDTQDSDDGPPPGVPISVGVRVTRPVPGEMDRTTTQPGSVQAFESDRLFARVSGYMKTVNVRIGDRVSKGQVLATVDVPELEKQVERHAAGVEQANARVKQMKARLVSARADLEASRAAVVQAEAVARTRAAELRFRDRQLRRMQDLFALKSIDERLVDEKTEQRDAAVEAELAAKSAIVTTKAQVAASEAKIAQTEADVIESEAEVKVAQAELEKAQVLVRFATITSPMEGVITQRGLDPGGFVRAAQDGTNTMPLLTVQRTDRMIVVVQIPDRDVPFADPGDDAVIEFDALGKQKFPAKVSRVAQSEDSETRLMRVELDLANPNRRIRNGMYGHVTIILEKSSLLAMPSSCLVGRAQDGKGTVYVVRDGHARSVPVRIGADDGVKVGILEGLTEADEVILHPSSEITDGRAVQIVTPEGHP